MEMPTNPKAKGDHINAVLDGWEEHAADATFDGFTDRKSVV